MTATKAQAEHALAEYNANYEQRGEMEYPHWADAVLAAIEQAEQLTQQVVIVGGAK